MTPDFGWLREERGPRRLGSLRLIGRAIRGGWLSGAAHAERRGALLAVLIDLATGADPTATADERIAAARIIARTQGALPFCRLVRPRR